MLQQTTSNSRVEGGPPSAGNSRLAGEIIFLNAVSSSAVSIRKKKPQPPKASSSFNAAVGRKAMMWSRVTPGRTTPWAKGEVPAQADVPGEKWNCVAECFPKRGPGP